MERREEAIEEALLKGSSSEMEQLHSTDPKDPKAWFKFVLTKKTTKI